MSHLLSIDDKWHYREEKVIINVNKILLLIYII